MRPRAWILSAITMLCTTTMSAQLSNLAEPGGNLPHYTVVDLGTLGGTFSWATGVNNKGLVTGFSTIPGDSDEHAFLWQDGSFTDLGTLGGPNSGVGFWGRRPNERGQIVGAAQTNALDPVGEDFCQFINNFGFENAAPFRCLPFVWQDGAMTPLSTLEGNGAASQINNRGQVAGEVDGQPDPACTPQTPRPGPVMWEDGVLRELPRLPGFPYGGPNAINDNGQAVGGLVKDCAASVAHAALWDRGRVTFLGSLGGQQFDEGASINNAGQVVGFASLPGNTVFHAFFWSKRDGMKDLGTLPGDVLSFAAGINDESQIVGTSFDVNGNPRAFFEQDGVMTDLNTLVASSPLYLLYGFDINSRGEIVGLGVDTISQEFHAYLANSCDELNADKSCDQQLKAAAAARQSRPVPENIRKHLLKRLGFSSAIR
jgi:probable HAF family extracellular repeat protein